MEQGSAPAAAPVSDSTHVFTSLRTGTINAGVLGNPEVLWRHTVDDLGPVAADGQHVYAAMQGAVEAVAASSGEPVWRALVAGRPSALVATAGWVIAFLESGTVEALHADTGERVWQRPIGPTLPGNAVVAGDRVFVATAAGDVAALRVLDGLPVWTTKIAGTGTGLTALGDRLYVGADKFFFALDAETGRIEWRWRIGAAVIGPPAVDERHVYVTALDNQIRALDRRSGAQRWRQALPARPVAGPVVVDGAVLAPCLAPEVLALRARDGSVLGRYATDRDLAVRPIVLARPYALGGSLVVVILSNGSTLALQRRIEPPVAPLAVLPGVALSVPVPAAAPDAPATVSPGPSGH
jgi:outer membrane protein assembly factor BamB